MIALLANGRFRRLWIAQTLSVFGDWMLVVAVPFFVYRRTGSSTATAIVFAAEAIPQVLVAPFAGVLVDRVNRGLALVVANLAAAAVILGLLLAEAWDLLPVLYVVVFLQSCITQVLVPARNALVPELVAADDLSTANALDHVSDSVIRLAAPALGGALLAITGLAAPVLIDSLTFLLAALVLLPLRHTSKEREDAVATRRVVTELGEGFRLTIRDPAARVVGVTFFAAMFGQGLLNVAFVAVVASFGGPAAYGTVIAAQGVGALAGALVAPRLVRRLGTQRTIVAAFVMAALLVGCYGVVRSLAWAVVLSLLVGVAAVQILIAGQTLLQTDIDIRFLGRVSGALSSSMAIALLAGLGAAAAAAPVVGPRALLGVAAGSLAVAAVATALMRTSRSVLETPVSHIS